MVTDWKSLFLLDPDIHFLNHGSFGACPIPVMEVYQNWQRRLERQPVLFLGREMVALDQEARRALGAYLHTSENNLVFITNATQGVNIIARTLALGPGDEILTTDHEYGACDYTWEFTCMKSGAAYVHHSIPLPAHSSEELIDQFWNGVTPRTKVIYLSHITSPTALKLPVEAICARARQAGIQTLVDGAHAPGQIPLNMENIGADMYIGNCHKWMLSPKGAGFLYARREVQSLIEPLVVSWGYHATPETSSGSRFIDLFQWTGTKDPAASLSVPAAIDFMKTHDWHSAQKQSHQLLSQAIARICSLTDLPYLYPLDSDLYHQMGIAPLPPDVDLIDLKRRLYDEYRIEVPLIRWNEQQFIRISIQAYNLQSDVDILVDALRTLLS